MLPDRRGNSYKTVKVKHPFDFTEDSWGAVEIVGS